jgi:hypothetical protein
MARSWSGFLPQNQDIKEQWQILENQASDGNFRSVPEKNGSEIPREPADEDLAVDGSNIKAC